MTREPLRPLDVPRVYAIADAGAFGARDLAAVVGELEDAGVRWIQLRAKGFSGAQWARAMDAVCSRPGGRSRTSLWVNDRVDVAAAYPVLGVHLGQGDLPPAAARRVLPAHRLIGLSTHNPEQARWAQRERAVDVIAIGPVFATRTKDHTDPAVGLHGVEAARQASTKPLVAIGGISLSNAAAVWRSGADAVAVISALLAGDSPGAAATALLRAAEGAPSPPPRREVEG